MSWSLINNSQVLNAKLIFDGFNVAFPTTVEQQWMTTRPFLETLDFLTSAERYKCSLN